MDNTRRTLGDKTKDMKSASDIFEEENLPERVKNNKFFRFFYKLCTHGAFDFVIMMMIIANTIVLALDRHPIDPTDESNNELANNILSWCFFTEMIIKLIGLGFKGYASDRFNLFDCFIVLVSLAENILEWTLAGGSVGTGGAISAFRGFRLFRVFKLARSWKKFRDLIFKIGKTLKDVSNFSVLLILFMFTYTLLGMELFAYKVRFDENNQIDLVNGSPPRANFNTLLDGFTTVFIVLIAEDWNGVMYAYARVMGGGSIIYFVSLVIFGNFIMLNLFLAILLKNFEEDDKLDEIEEKEDQKKGALKSTLSKIKNSIAKKLKRLVSSSKNQDESQEENGSAQVSPKKNSKEGSM